MSHGASVFTDGPNVKVRIAPKAVAIEHIAYSEMTAS